MNSAAGAAAPGRKIRTDRSEAAGARISPRAAQDAPWKVGASETSHGQTVTGTMVGRSHCDRRRAEHLPRR
ncbi:MAG: hypothetical protein H6960_01565 [Chromatiaceae bacterium]|nr:hypothetical protein [Chromatiaceae bacterium]